VVSPANGSAAAPRNGTDRMTIRSVCSRASSISGAQEGWE
jgi:hypothetical protein